MWESNREIRNSQAEDSQKLRGENFGGATKTLSLRKPQLSWETWTTPTEIVAEVDRLLDHHTYGEIATLLNERKLRPGRGERFSSRIIARIQTCYALRPRYDRLRQAGMMT